MPFLVLRTVRALWFHAFVRIISSHEKTGTKGPVFPMPDDIRRGRKLSAARSSDILRGSYRLSPQSPASSQTAPFQTPRYHTTTRPCVSRGFAKIFGSFLRIWTGFFVRFAKERKTPPLSKRGGGPAGGWRGAPPPYPSGVHSTALPSSPPSLS